MHITPPLSFFKIHIENTFTHEVEDLKKVGTDVFSIFSWRTHDDEVNSCTIETDKLSYTLTLLAKSLNHDYFARWLQIVFYYFREKSAMPELAKLIAIDFITLIQFNLFRPSKLNAILTLQQIASWAKIFFPDMFPHLIKILKSIQPTNPEEIAYTALFFTTSINTDRVAHYSRLAYSHREYLSPLNKLSSVISYHKHAETQEEKENILSEAISLFKNDEIQNHLKNEATILNQLLFVFFSEEIPEQSYRKILTIFRHLKGMPDNRELHANHAFVTTNHDNHLIFLTKSEIIKSETNQSELLSTAINLQNECLNISTTISGNNSIKLKTIEKETYGIPQSSLSFEKYKESVIHLYDLLNFHEEYKYISQMTILPATNHPIQSCLCYFDVEPPIISINLIDHNHPNYRKYAVFLASSSYSCDMEGNFISQKLGIEAEIIVDPSKETFIDKLSDPSFTDFYISAHGIYNHWSDGCEKIHFSENCEITIDDLNKINNKAPHTQKIILNICDGANARISTNPLSTGLSATLAKNNFVIISHLWPVNPLYAAIWGCLMTFNMREHNIQRAMLTTFKILNQENTKITQNLASIAANETIPTVFDEIIERITRTDLSMKDYKMIGSPAIYG